jgi:ABC-type nitrate/sulfonate/bicarbonate transport system substrate-binding protein
MKWDSKRKTGRRALLAVVLATALAAVTACSSGTTPKPTTTASAGAATLTPLKLSIGIPAVSTVFTDLYYGAQEGYFKKAGLDLTFQNVGTNGPNLLASGQINLFVFGSSTPLLMSQQGKATSLVFGTLGAGDSGAITVLKSSGINNIQQLGGKRVAVQGVGGSTYGWGQIYSNYITQHGGTKPNIISVPTATQIVQGLTSGQYDAAVITGGFFAQQVHDGTAKYLVNPSTAAGKKFIEFAGGQYPETGWFGTKAGLAQNGEAVSRFLAALSAADTAVHKQTPDKIAAVLHQQSDWSTTPAATIALSVQYDLKFMDPNKGFISAADWKSALSHMTFWNVSGLNYSAGYASYKQAVDMSYLTAANKLKIDFSKLN